MMNARPVSTKRCDFLCPFHDHSGSYPRGFSRSRVRSPAAVVMFILLWSGLAQAQDLTASYYSVESLKREGTWSYSKGAMANGRQFSDNNLTAASWDWPLGTKVRVTRKDTKASVVVLVTDRTARRFKGKRIDLSYTAMYRLDGIHRGLVPVSVEVVA